MKENLSKPHCSSIVICNIFCGNKATIISAHVPTLMVDDCIKQEFFQQLDSLLSQIPSDYWILPLGDFHARIGRDESTRGGVIGREGIGNNGRLQLNTRTELDLAITNKLFCREIDRKLHRYIPHTTI